MQFTPSTLAQPAVRALVRPPGLATIVLNAAAVRGVVSDPAVMQLLEAYRGSGGLARSDEVMTLLDRRRGLDADQLSRWRREDKVIAFEWHAHTWLPRFQFAAAQLPDSNIAAVLAVLKGVFSDWEAACWFARPHPALDQRAPATVIPEQWHAVQRAARGDRFALDA